MHEKRREEGWGLDKVMNGSRRVGFVIHGVIDD